MTYNILDIYLKFLSRATAFFGRIFTSDEPMPGYEKTTNLSKKKKLQFLIIKQKNKRTKKLAFKEE